VYGLYFLSVWIHIIAATIWVGGMLFLVLVVVPWLRRGDPASAGKMLRETGARFRNVGWVCFGLLLLTGTFNLWVRGVRLPDFTRTEWLSSGFGGTVVAKLALFAGVLVVSVVHDFFVGPRATAELARRKAM
jgi:putative copper export protein